MMDFLRGPNTGHPNVDEFYGARDKAVSILCFMAAVELVDHPLHDAFIERPVWYGHAQLIPLANIARVGRALERDIRGIDIISHKLLAEVVFHVGKVGIELRII